jgi:hypothetical protein
LNANTRFVSIILLSVVILVLTGIVYGINNRINEHSEQIQYYQDNNMNVSFWSHSYVNDVLGLEQVQGDLWTKDLPVVRMLVPIIIGLVFGACLIVFKVDKKFGR